jgi:microsomal dipeptidase-like Zn-dependent dipeptidase
VLSERAGLFSFRRATGCPSYPEIEVGARGHSPPGPVAYGEVSGLIDAHMHHMAFEFLGGRAHCGRPWHRFGAPFALQDCPDHEPNGAGAILENTVSYGNPAGTHDTDGWPTFEGWPHHASLTHEQSYYKWLERAWRGGLRIFVNLLVENEVLCELYPLKKNSCNEMQSARLQAKRMRQLQDYIDAQNGGPGKGWFRIVRNPFQARKVINQGKLAVVMGLEVSKPFDCGRFNGQPTCTRQSLDRKIDQIHDLGVRQLELVNKFDNAFTGVAGDSGETGTITNSGNFYDTGRFWAMESCEDPRYSDRTPTAAHYHNDDALIANGFEALIPKGAVPVYPDPPLCNTLRLSDLGEHAIRRIIDKEMIFDPDHMGVYARRDALGVLEEERYSGVISSHSWSTEDALPRIYKLGGVVTPYAGASQGFVNKWRTIRKYHSGRQYFGFGYGADMNGFGSQGGPRGADAENPVTYPFRSYDGEVTLTQQRSGSRVYDINTDGVAHYGLYPDWIEDLRMLAGDRIIRDMGRGAEAYLQMWERAVGIEPVDCDAWRGDSSRQGLGRLLRLGDRPEALLKRAGQPVNRTRAWHWCAATGGTRAKPAERGVRAVFTDGARVGLALSTVTRHDAAGIQPGDRAGKVRRRADRAGSGLWVRSAGAGRRFVYEVAGGRVRQVGVGTRAATSRGELERHVNLAG